MKTNYFFLNSNTFSLDDKFQKIIRFHYIQGFYANEFSVSRVVVAFRYSDFQWC